MEHKEKESLLYRIYDYSYRYLFLHWVLVIFIIFTIIYGIKDDNLLGNFIKIITSRSVLVTDYLKISSLGATLLNATLIFALNLYILTKTRQKGNGAYFAGIFIVIGFSFFGKNILNILPIYLGILLYAKYEKVQFRRYFIIALFATGLAPIVSFGFGYGIILTLIGIFSGIIYGFIIPTFAAHSIRFHNGYTLFNLGFSAGFIAIIVHALVGMFWNEYTIESGTTLLYSFELYLLATIISIMYLIIGIITCEDKRFYKRLIKMSGRAVSDFTNITSKEVTFINIGIMGLLTILTAIITRSELNSITFGAIATVIGFSAFGMHPRNCFPIVASVLVFAYLFHGNISASDLSCAFFACGLAPIAGDFGIIFGVIAGIFHYSLINASVVIWHGGMDLYNNGFVTGIIAALMSSVLDTITLGRKKQ